MTTQNGRAFNEWLRAQLKAKKMSQRQLTPQSLGLVAAGNTNPTARVEYALRADELLSEPQVRQIMEYYLAVRMRRYGRTFQPAESGNGADRTLIRSNGRLPTSASPVG